MSIMIAIAQANRVVNDRGLGHSQFSRRAIELIGGYTGVCYTPIGYDMGLSRASRFLPTTKPHRYPQRVLGMPNVMMTMILS